MTSIEIEIFFLEEQPARPPFLKHKWDEEILKALNVEPVDEKLRRYDSYWLRTCNKAEQQQDAKNTHRKSI